MQDLKEALAEVIPAMPQSFENKISNTLLRLPAKPRKKNRIARAAMIACAVLLFAACGVFAAKPALAADIPLVNEVVYALSPGVAVDDTAKARIRQSVFDALNLIFDGSLDGIGQRFKAGKNWVLNSDTLLAVYYLQYMGAAAAVGNDGQTPAAADISIDSIQAEARAFRYHAQIRFSIVQNGKKTGEETLAAVLEDTAKGMMITDMKFESASFAAYKDKISAYQHANPQTPLQETIGHYNAFLIGQAIAEQGKQKAGISATPRTKEEKMADTAVQLMYRYWLARKTGQTPDFIGLMERNQNTEAFFLAADINARLTAYRIISKAVTVEKGYGEIIKTTNSKSLYDTHLWVKTIIEGGIGEELLLKFRPEGEGFIIIAFDEIGDGVYRTINYKAKKYRKSGSDAMEALKMAHDEWAKEIEQKAAMIADYMRQGMAEEEARQKAAIDWADTHK
jgi:hypothetical protein